MRLPPADVNMKFVGIYVHDLNHASDAAHPLTKAAIEPGTKLGFCTMDGGRIRCVASVGQKWRNPVHTSREGGCEDKGDYEARMPSIIRRSTPLWVYTQQRLRHNGLVRGSARWICSCSTKKTLRLQSLFDTWLTRFQIRIDKICTNLYNLCIKNVSDTNMWHPS